MDLGDQAAEAGRQRMVTERAARGWTFDEFAARTDIVVVEDNDGISRLYRVRSMEPTILERAAGPATVYDERYHRIIAVAVSLHREM